MKVSILATSLMALALFAGPAAAQQADQPATDQAAPSDTGKLILPPAVAALLDDTRAVSELSDKELSRRVKQSRQFMKLEGLAPDVQQALQAKADDAQAELANRQQGGGGNENAGGTQQQDGSGQSTDSGAQSGQQQQPVQVQDAAPAETPVPQEVLTYLSDDQPASGLAAGDLKSRIDQGRKLLGLKDLPKDIRASLAAKLEADRAEFKARSKAVQQQDNGGAPQPDTATGQQTPPETSGGLAVGGGQDGNGSVTAYPEYFRLPPSLSAMSDDDLRARFALGRTLMKKSDLAPDVRQRIATLQTLLRAELDRRPQDGRAPASKQGASGGDSGGFIDQNPVVDIAGENQAKSILADGQPAESMRLKDLRRRVTLMRSLLQENQLSPHIRQALYRKLGEDRDVLRSRMAEQEGGLPPGLPGGESGAGYDGQQQAQPGGGQFGDQMRLDPRMVMKYGNDQRPPQRLDDNELRLRINIFVNVLGGDRYPQIDRYDWQRRLQRDREELRMRLLAERAQRQSRLRDMNDEIVLDEQQAPDYDPAAAEVDDQELQDTLSAAPRRKFSRRYSLQDFENSPELRAAVPRIEIDTIHFGFNESFVREEEIGNLDRVAEIMEKILARHPEEIFLIEGHTDASGSDAYNLGLSRQRAEAVRQALSTYYVIPPQNLRTVGYGERYLKIPVEGPEGENRRVSVSRITDVIGQD